MKPQLVKVITPNKMLFLKGRLVRTPLEIVITYENELNLLKASMSHQAINFEIEDYKPVEKKPAVKPMTTNKTSKVKKKTSTPKTILEKLSKETE